jgi:hypothetical protein
MILSKTDYYHIFKEKDVLNLFREVLVSKILVIEVNV